VLKAVKKITNVHRLKKLTSTLIHDALAEMHSEYPTSSLGHENRFRTAEYFLLEARDYVDGAWEMLAIGNTRVSLAISRWTLEAALNLLWVVRNQGETDQRLADLVGETLRQEANLCEGLAEMRPDQADAFKQRANSARKVKGELGCARLDSLEKRMKDAKPPEKPDWPDLYVHYRVCSAASHPGLKVCERFKTVGQATASTKASDDTTLTSDMAMWMAATSAFWLVSFACSLANTGNAEKLKEWWDAEVAPLLGN